MKVGVLMLSLTLLGWWPSAVAAVTPLPAVQDPPVQDTTFRHAAHEAVTCTECHMMTSTHGARLVRDISDCRTCHHAAQRTEKTCVECHDASDMLAVVHTIPRTFDLSVRDDPYERDIAFRHADHEERDCVECHVEGPSLAVPDLDCQSCHEEHHAADDSGCWSCHRDPPAEAHTVAVHLTCSGSGCHVDAPVEGPARTRVQCLWCHQEQADHEPGGECVDCHKIGLPPVIGGRP